MQGETKQRRAKLCEQAATEQDHERLMALIHEINQLLERKEKRLNSEKQRERAQRLESGFCRLGQSALA